MGNRHTIRLHIGAKAPDLKAMAAKRIAEAEKVDRQFTQKPFSFELKEGDLSVWVHNDSVQGVVGEWEMYLNTECKGSSDDIRTGFTKEVSGNFAECCDRLVVLLNNYIGRQKSLIADAQMMIDRLSEAMLGNGELASRAEEFEGNVEMMGEIAEELSKEKKDND